LESGSYGCFNSLQDEISVIRCLMAVQTFTKALATSFFAAPFPELQDGPWLNMAVNNQSTTLTNQKVFRAGRSCSDSHFWVWNDTNMLPVRTDSRWLGSCSSSFHHLLPSVRLGNPSCYSSLHSSWSHYQAPYPISTKMDESVCCGTHGAGWRA
jgi:hypothetical protein